MKTAGIIAEYDPFHNGHAYQIAKTRENGAEAVVVVLGGEFTQRGEPAWCSKYLRTKTALACGADLVLEMPVPYAVGSAERFAEGGVKILNALGCIDTLCFGSESGNAEDIMRFAKICESPDFIREYKLELEKGVSAPAARQNAIDKIAPELSEIAAMPNNTLGAEYCKWLLRLNSSIAPSTVKRYGAGHGEAAVLKSGIASATYLRSFTGPEDIYPFVPAKTHSLLENEHAEGKLPFDEHRYEIMALALLRNMSEEDFAKVPDCAAEGLYHRVCDAVREATSLGELYDLIKTKRYAMSRVKRIIAGAVLGLDGSVLKNCELPYIRVLGMNEIGAAVLKAAKAANCPLPISASLAELEKTGDTAKYFAALEAKAEDIWQLGLPTPGKCGMAYTNKLIKM